PAEGSTKFPCNQLRIRDRVSVHVQRGAAPHLVFPPEPGVFVRPGRQRIPHPPVVTVIQIWMLPEDLLHLCPHPLRHPLRRRRGRPPLRPARAGLVVLRRVLRHLRRQLLLGARPHRRRRQQRRQHQHRQRTTHMSPSHCRKRSPTQCFSHTQYEKPREQVLPGMIVTRSHLPAKTPRIAPIAKLPTPPYTIPRTVTAQGVMHVRNW